MAILRVILAGAAGLAAMSAPAFAAVQCPATHGGQRLKQFEVYEGDPAELQSLVPDSSRAGKGGAYTNVWQLDPKTKYNVVCLYRDDKQVQLSLPPGLKRCRASGSPRDTSGMCE